MGYARERYAPAIGLHRMHREKYPGGSPLPVPAWGRTSGLR